MGSCISCDREFDELYRTETFQGWMEQFSTMQLSKGEIRTLYYVFCKVDMDGSGSIGLPELLMHINLERTKFTERIFSIFDEDGSGEIDFREFVLSLWNYCTLTKATLDMFAFDLYDKDSSGELSASEVTRMLQDIYGSNAKSNFLAKSVANDLKEIEKAGQLLDIEQFRLFAKTHQALLFPAFQMQLALQQKILGVRFWERNAKKRLKFSNGKYISVGNFILYNVDAKKKTLLSSDSPAAVTVYGETHVDRDVGRLMEVAGTKAARRNTHILNEKTGGLTSAELFGVKQKRNYDTNVPMDEGSKKAWLRAIFTVPGGGHRDQSNTIPQPNSQPNSTSISTGISTGSSSAHFGAPSTSSKGMVKAKSARHLDVSSPVASHKSPIASQKSQAATIEAVGSGSGRARRNSTDHRDREPAIELSVGSHRPRRNSHSLDHDHGIAISGRDGGGGGERSDGHTRKRAGSRDAKEDTIPSGRIKNSNLTRDAIGKIEQVSPIEAWQNQPAAATGSKKKQAKSAATSASKAVTAGIAAITASAKFRFSPHSAAVAPAPTTRTSGGAAAGAGATSPEASGEHSVHYGRSGKGRNYTAVEAFEASGFSDDEKEPSAKPAAARRQSLSRHANANASNSAASVVASVAAASGNSLAESAHSQSTKGQSRRR